ncbi:MAG: hypothetical protein LBN27_10745 [Prevotellaceae bacterium]|jgi:hypothetical protein|nr:hypothetical protein [Prevotellaceae bacterium]
MELKVFDAIRQMRELSQQEKPFSFSFMSYSRTRQTSDGVVQVRRGLLRRRAASNKHNRYEPFMENYYDLDAQEDCRFWQMLLISFNGQNVQLL